MLSRESVLQYVASLRTAPAEYRMTANVDGSLFTACFAFLLRYLLGDDYAPEERAALQALLLESQNPEDGLWYRRGKSATRYTLHDEAHISQQLTTMALSVLAALGVMPRYPLRFLSRWDTADKLQDYLDSLPWDVNPWNSGNRALFVGSFLAYDGYILHNEASRAVLEAWFDWHDAHARPTSGFWGEGHTADWFVGMGGAAHQYLIYHYANRQPPYLERAVDQTLRMQYDDGRCWPVIGGGSCYELDAMEILLLGYKMLDYRRSDIEAACCRMIPVVLNSRNADGGFCWAKRRWFDMPDLLRGLFITGDPRTMFWALRVQANAHLLRSEETRATAWASAPHPVTESSLYDTWFRLLTLAEIAEVIADERLPDIPWRSVPAPNWGFFRR